MKHDLVCYISSLVEDKLKWGDLKITTAETKTCVLLIEQFKIFKRTSSSLISLVRYEREIMTISEFEIKRYEKIVGQYVEKRRPPAHVRNQVDLAFRLENQSVIIFEIRELWEQPGKKIESPIAKATYVKATKSWKLYWQRADLKWHRYEPTSETKNIEEFLAVVEKDEYGCFWG